ncbi:unnamed protein product [Amoebophrya sp. A25]|nr:unnamed protein product [Amoebophrya sp. A25]|eukprot:GSA25T00017299001.1
MLSMVLMTVAIMGSMEEVTTDSPEVVASGNIIAEAVLNIKTVKALRAEEAFLGKFNQMTNEIAKNESKKSMWAGLAFGFSNGMMGAIFIVSFWYGAELVKEDGLSPTDMFKAVMCIFFAGMAAGQAAACVPNTARAVAAAHDIFALVDRVPLAKKIAIDQDGENIKQASSFEQKFQSADFQDVEFAYPQRASLPILRKVDLELQHGQSLALAGPSGSGKSTILSLLQRFYDPSSGQVELKMLDDENKGLGSSHHLKDVNLRQWRNKIGYVGQEPVLFNLSARENIFYGIDAESEMKMGNKEQRFKDVVRQAHIDFIGGQNQLGWDERLGPRGSKISGGQKQRIAIARALMRDPAILMLDEATSALDAVSEREVQKALEDITTGPTTTGSGAGSKTTTVTIAHRLSTVANCDKIIVMCDGSVLEQGSHEALLAKEGLYHKLARSSVGGT